MCPRSQSWRAIGSHVQYDGTTDKYNEREKKQKKVLLWRPERPIKPPITPVSKRRACVFCYNPEKGAQTVLRSIFLKQLWCVHNKAAAPFFFFIGWSNVSIAICQEEPMNNNTSEETLGRFRRQEEIHTHTQSQSLGRAEREKSHSRMTKTRQACIRISEIVTYWMEKFDKLLSFKAALSKSLTSRGQNTSVSVSLSSLTSGLISGDHHHLYFVSYL